MTTPSLGVAIQGELPRVVTMLHQGTDSSISAACTMGGDVGPISFNNLLNGTKYFRNGATSDPPYGVEMVAPPRTRFKNISARLNA